MHSRRLASINHEGTDSEVFGRVQNREKEWKGEIAMVDFGNTCAIICRLVLIVVLVIGIIVSCLVVPACHFISAVTHNEDTHGVGLQTFENEGGHCEPHNSFIFKNYNGMEVAAKVGGYVAPACASLAVLFLLVECCRRDGLFCGKCIPGLLLLCAVVCQGVTFLLFQSELFCSNKDIARCDMGATGRQSVYACLVFAFCAVLYFCSPAPRPLSLPGNKTKDSPKSKKKKKDKLEPDKGEDWTKEMYERRRKERNVKGRGVSGRKKEKITEDKNEGRRRKDKGDDADGRRRDGRQKARDDDADGRRGEARLTVYDPGPRRGAPGGRGPPPPKKFDDYVDTEPDGMDWSAYTPDRREAYHERQRRKKQEKREKKERRERAREREREDREKQREWERGRSIDADHSRDGRPGGGDSYDESYGRSGDGYNDSYGQDSFYSERDRGRGNGYELSPYGDSRDGRGRDDYGDSYRDSYRSGRDSRDYSRSPRGRGDSSAQDSYSYAQDSYAYRDDSPGDDSFYDQRDGGRSGGGRGSKRRSHDESYSTFGDSYDRRGHRDDPSFA